MTIHVHQRDVTAELAALAKNKRITDANDFEWLKQARFYWRDGIADEISPDGTVDYAATSPFFLSFRMVLWCTTVYCTVFATLVLSCIFLDPIIDSLQ